MINVYEPEKTKDGYMVEVVDIDFRTIYYSNFKEKKDADEFYKEAKLKAKKGITLVGGYNA